MFCKTARQLNRIFQRQLGAAANRKMRGMRRIAHQHDRHALAGHGFVMHPVRAHHARKADPAGRATHMRRVAHERMAAKVPGEQPLAKCNAVLLAHLVQAMGFPDGFGGFDDEGRRGAVKLVGMGGKPAVFGLLEGKGEGVKGLARSQPDEAAVAQLDVGLEGAGVAGADAAVQAVAGDHQIGVVPRGGGLVILHVGFKHQLDAQFDAAVLQNIEQALAAYAAKTVSARAHAAALEKHLDIIPVVEGVANQLGADRVGSLQVAQRLVRQHHAPAKGVERAVALDHRDPVRRLLQLHEQAEIQTGGTTAKTKDVHGMRELWINLALIV